MYTGPNTDEDGLVFGYDADDRSSRYYKGEPTTNLITNPIPTSSSGYNVSGGIGSVTFDVSTNSLLYYLTGYEVWGSYMNIPPSFDGTLDVNSQYTISFEWRNKSDVSNNPFIWNLVQGNGLNPAGECVIINNSTLQENGWYKFTYTFIPNNSGVNTAYNRIYLGDQGVNVTRFYIRNIQFEKKPRPTQFINGTRSSAQSLLDIKKTSTIDLSNVNFDWTGHPYFNSNSSNYISIPHRSEFNLGTQGTLSVWMRPDDLTQLNYSSLIAKNSGGSNGTLSYELSCYWGTIHGQLHNQTVNNAISVPFPTQVKWYNYVFTWDGTYLRLYQDGVQIATPVSQTIIPEPLNTPITIGGLTYNGAGGVDEYFKGNIKTAKIYNRTFSDDEILEKYNTEKWRFLDENNLDNGLVMHLDAGNKNSYISGSTTWYDLAGNSNNVSLVNGPTWNQSGYFINDSDSYFEGSGTSSIPIGNSPYTMIVWARQNSTYGWGNNGLISIGGFGTGNASNSLRTVYNTTGYFWHYWWSNDIGGFDSTISLNKWFMVTVTYDGINRRIYSNGLLLSTDTPGIHLVSSTQIQISKTFSSEYQQGDIAVAKIYNRSLSDSEVLKLYNKDKGRFGL